jgi:cytosine/adenosine deaminase-related metal-dependent hydrolase
MTATLIRDAVVLTMRGGSQDVIRGDILVRNQVIEAVGGTLTAEDGAEVVDGRRFIVTPGLVNAHMHTWQTALRSVASNWTFPEYSRWVHAGLATHFQPKDIHIATLGRGVDERLPTTMIELLKSHAADIVRMDCVPPFPT